MPEINLVQPTKYIIQVKKIGMDTFSRGYSGIMSNKDPFLLGMEVCNLMGYCFMKDENNYNYELAIHLLATLKFDEKLISKHLEQIREKFRKITAERKAENEKEE